MARIIKPPYFTSVVNLGEQRLIDFLVDKLPDNYYLVPNVELASTNPRNDRTQYWEYDLIVVTPHAVYNIENKDWKGRIEGDDNYWYLNDRQRPNPLKTGRQKTAILASKLKEYNSLWAKAWVQNLVTLSYPNTSKPNLWQEAGKLTFQLDDRLIEFLTDSINIGKLNNEIVDIQDKIFNYLVGNFSKKKPNQKREVEGYEIIEILQQEENFVEYLVRPKGVSSFIRKRVKEYSLQVRGMTPEELITREKQLKNHYVALNMIKAKPFILNVEFRIDEENHLFYEISDFLDENSLRAEARHKTFTFAEKIGIIKNIMMAIKESHAVNVFHRDINPDNIFLIGGYAYLGNFGKSYFVDEYRRGYTVMATLSQSNTTPYHALELTVGDVSRATDLYSIGVLIYWLFTGNEPFKTPYELNNMGGQLPEELLPSKINTNLPDWLDEVCLKTILIDETLRLDNISELESLFECGIDDKNKHSNQSLAGSKASILPSNEFKEGDRIGTLTIYEILGKGGYSMVFKVKHGIQNKDYALKLFNESINISSVKDEYNALVELDHPNIVKFVWNDEAPNGQFYTVMEYLKGDTLALYTRTEAKLSIERVYQVAYDMLSALVEMQAQHSPIYHRDIKPQNIIWNDEKRFVLIDFNVATILEENKDFVGTNPYLAPDIISNNYRVDWDKSADTFALGVTLYELLCKQYPWNPHKLPIVSKSPISPRVIDPTISDEFSSFILKAIGTEKDKRFKSANDMFEALKSIPQNNLKQATENNYQDNTVDINNDPDFIQYINSLFSQSKSGNFGTRASIELHKYDEITYSETMLDKNLIPAVLDGKFKLLIITGNAGDGKTSFIKKLENNPRLTDLKIFENKNGAQFKIKGIHFESNYDGSQDENEKLNVDVLDDFFAPFENILDFSNSSEGRIIAINEGRLVEFLNTSPKYKFLSSIIEDYFYQENQYKLPDGLMVINLNLRSIVAKDINQESLFRKQLKILTEKKLWKKCRDCVIRDNCFIKYNVDSFNDSTSGESLISRMEWLLRTTILKRELHITMRDLRSFIAFTLTRDYNCEDVQQLIEQNKNTYPNYWQLYYFNITNPHFEDLGNYDRIIRLLRETDIGEVTIPNIDRDLFFGKHKESDYMEFSERKSTLLDEFNSKKTLLPAYEQNIENIEKIKIIHKIFVRHQYFEGKANLIEVQDGIKSNQDKDNFMPTYLFRLPYKSVYSFYRILEKGDSDNSIKKSISRAISLNEGCNNNFLDKQYLVLSSTEVIDPISKSFRLFDMDDFELIVNKSEQLIKYLEYEPDSLIFRHTKDNQIKLTISLDLFEMLYFIQQGFSPSLNDIRGKYVELVIFKNLLSNLEYKQVVLTKDNIEHFSISIKDKNCLLIQKLEV